jgi:tRNA 2-selenouridine synthase
MARSPTYTQFPLKETYSEIIDVRSESEFAEDHVPGAINLPVLDDEQREKVGTIYHQVSPFEARKMGASLVSENISKHLACHFSAQDKHDSFLVYCWRGGQRSHSLAQVLSQIGWRVAVVEGGYKTYRAYVRQQLEQLSQQFTYKILCGLTGTGKTYILEQLQSHGVQVLDLEGLANHRGSLLGQAWESEPQPQPAQKYFESKLLQQLQSLDPNKLVWVESESNKVGEIHLPPAFWEKMKQASCVEVQLPTEARVDGLLQAYPHWLNHPESLKSKLEMLKSRYGWSQIHHWHYLIDTRQWRALVRDLLESHYDPAYRRSMSKSYYQRVEKQLPIPDLAGQNRLALLDQLARYSL